VLVRLAQLQFSVPAVKERREVPRKLIVDAFESRRESLADDLLQLVNRFL